MFYHVAQKKRANRLTSTASSQLGPLASAPDPLSAAAADPLSDAAADPVSAADVKDPPLASTSGQLPKEQLTTKLKQAAVQRRDGSQLEENWKRLRRDAFEQLQGSTAVVDSSAELEDRHSQLIQVAHLLEKSTYLIQVS